MVRAGLLLLALAACDRAPEGAARADANIAAPRPAARAPEPVAVTPTIRVLELAGDMTLAEADRRRLVDLQAREHAHDAAADDKEDAELTRLLDQYASATAVQKAKIRHAIRTTLHFNRAKMTDPLPAELLARHDPVLVEDAARRELVTMADIRALDRANRFIARIAGTPMPELTEKPGERAELQRLYAADASMRTALTHAGPRGAAMIAAVDGLPAAKRAEIDGIIRTHVKTPEDAANAARGAENAVLQAEQRKAQRARNAAASADFNSWLQSRWQAQLYMAKMDGMMRVWDTENRTYPR